MPDVISEDRALRIFGLLGLAARAGQVTSGESACVDLIRSGKAIVCLVDEGSSDNAKKRLFDSCAHYGVAIALVPGERLGASIGKPSRKAVCLSKGSFAIQVCSLL
ncbi:MAG: ribosomal L7Ae/L30e/S12e/Gadd45 family protein [Eubacteriales bacterium]|nr:ribosomal L7Ae/L30e/S12e/Gadd45 family protein [Eubacteriales bacterium]MDD3882301.1 ribosomal L7Ae/L30e/S12e/Gadd45 family protein [Eubacteriales bacterium]MDD4512047.1 ribosomal L7Ae/L30e/S12e/Gadd45 family protein [Eubacteriales bacterium]